MFPRLLLFLACCASLALGRQAPPPEAPPIQEASKPDPDKASAEPARDSESHPAEPVPAPVQAARTGPVGPLSPPEPEPSATEPRYSLDATRQDAVAVINQFARVAHQPVAMLDRYAILITVRFKDLSFEQGLRKILLAADLDYVKDADGYTVGLPNDLKVRFAQPGDEVIDGTYRCRRISAASLVKTIVAIMGEEKIHAFVGPEFLTPALEQANTGSGDQSIKALSATDATYHTHDVVFSGAPAYVRRALSLARKFDRPRRQARVNVRIVEITSKAAQNLGVNWMSSLTLTATEYTTDSTGAMNPAATPVPGIRLGKFAHTPVSLNATLNALESSGGAKTLSNPTLLVLDGEKSFILSGTKYVFPKIESRDSTGNPVYGVMVEKLGVYLQVGVQIGLDDDITLNIYPQVTSLQGVTNIQGVDYPIINTDEEEATVRAGKGEVIVLGGLKATHHDDNKSGVPFLSRLPILGKLFAADSSNDSSNELMFFLTPEIQETDFAPPLNVKIDESPAPEPQPQPAP
jgi:hypothetical protein